MNPWFYFIMGVALSLLVWLISRFVSNRKENTTVLKKQKKTFENYNDRQHQRDGLNEALKKRHEQQRNFNEVLRRRQEQQGNLDKKSATPPLLRQPTNPILRPRMLPPSNKYSPPPSLRKDGSPFIPKPYIAKPSDPIKNKGESDKAKSKPARLWLPETNEARIEPEVKKTKTPVDRRQTDVALALSSPAIVTPQQNFMIRFAAYPESEEENTRQMLTLLSPANTNYLGLDYCKWKTNTEVTVKLYSEFLKVDKPIQSFTWMGKRKILNYNVAVLENAPPQGYIDVDADILIADITIAHLSFSQKIGANPSVDVISIKTRPYKSAFASYAREDSNLVVGRLSEIEQNGIKIFWDRLNLHNHEKWKSQLENAIKDSEAFLLFWSSHASQSEWVNWEWQTALQHKGLRSIEPHPLEGPDEAPPPDELKELHFDDKYLYFRNRNK